MKRVLALVAIALLPSTAIGGDIITRGVTDPLTIDALSPPSGKLRVAGDLEIDSILSVLNGGTLEMLNGGTWTAVSDEPDSISAVGFSFDTAAFSSLGSQNVRFRNGATSLLSVSSEADGGVLRFHRTGGGDSPVIFLRAPNQLAINTTGSTSNFEFAFVGGSVFIIRSGGLDRASLGPNGTGLLVTSAGTSSAMAFTAATTDSSTIPGYSFRAGVSAGGTLLHTEWLESQTTPRRVAKLDKDGTLTSNAVNALDNAVADVKFVLRGKFDSDAGAGITQGNTDFAIVHDVLSTTPTSKASFRFDDVEKASVDQDGRGVFADGINSLATTTVSSPVVVAAAPPTSGDVLTATGATSATWQAPTGGGDYTLQWGSRLMMTGRFALANGLHVSADSTVLDHTSEHTVPKAGTIKVLTWNSQAADATTIIKVHKNAVVVETVTLTGLTGAVTTLTTTVVAGDQLGVEYDAGTAPDRGTFILLIQ